ncbi:MAG: hypothetical protein LBR29_02080 [Methylobacteriaceae bacterium]|nr:hypothetical protein [Methylobacteriaceae bacterium]
MKCESANFTVFCPNFADLARFSLQNSRLTGKKPAKYYDFSNPATILHKGRPLRPRPAAHKLTVDAAEKAAASDGSVVHDAV